MRAPRRGNAWENCLFMGLSPGLKGSDGYGPDGRGTPLPSFLPFLKKKCLISYKLLFIIPKKNWYETR